MTDTVNLGLPCIEGSQAQKHVTHNDALRILDALVQLAVLDRDLTDPPGTPAEGERWIVKAPATGAWSGHDNAVAAWQDGGWQFNMPQTGWFAFVVDEGMLVVWNGSAWGDFFATVTAIQNLALLGVGTTADATNPLSAKLNNVLVTAKTVAEGGDGNLRYKLSKESAAKTLSLLLQDNFSGRAEIGLAGDDDFHFKVSPDGSTWYEGIKIAAATGKVTYPVTGGPREMLTADRTYYVRSDGSDSNSGLANTAGGAFLTIQKAVDVIASLDLSIYQATIQVGDGTYTGAVALKNYIGANAPIIQGNATTPASVLISTTSAHAILNDRGGLWTVKDLKLQTGGTFGNCLIAANSGTIYFSNLDFGTCVGFHVYAQAGSMVKATGNYAVSGGAQMHAAANAYINLAQRTVSYSNSPAFTTANFLAGRGGGTIDCYGMTFVNGGTVTGPRYLAIDNGVIFTNTGGSPTFLPGSSTGSTATGGQYD
jgi:Protein of unknown function (DUF2793)